MEWIHQSDAVSKLTIGFHFAFSPKINSVAIGVCYNQTPK